MQTGWHGKPLKADVAEAAVRALGGVSDRRVETPPRPPRPAAVAARERHPIILPKYEMGMKVATRAAFGDALAALGARPEVVAIDGEVGNSTFTEKFRDAYPDRFFQMYISEQQMIGAAVGMSVRGYVPFAATFAAFLTRAYDFIRMAAVSRADIRLCGSHAGVEIGQDGPSQMGLEDLAALRAVHGSTVLYPSDANSAAALTAAMADLTGVSYLRTTRGAYPVLYPADEEFPVGGSKLLHASDDDHVLLAGAGVTVHTCLEAAERLSRAGHAGARHRPLLGQAAGRGGSGRGGARGRTPHRRRRGPLSGGRPGRSRAGRPRPSAGDVPRGAPRRAGLPGSGTPAELMEAAGISARDVEAAALRLLVGRP